MGDEYTVVDRAVPTVCYLVFSIIAVGLAFGGIMNMQLVVDGAVGTVCELEGLVLDGEDLMDELVAPIDTISGFLDNTIGLVGEAIDSTTNIEHTFNGLKGSLNKFGDIMSAYSLPGGYTSDLLTNSQTLIENVILDMDTKALSTIQSLEITKDQVDTQIRGAEENFENKTVAANGAVASIKQDTFGPMGDATGDVKGIIASGLSIIQPASMGFYSIVFFAFIAGVVAITLYFTPCSCDDKVAIIILNCSWVLTYLFVTLLFLLGGILLPVSVVFSDVCVVLYEIPNDFENYLGAFMPESGDGLRMLESGDMMSSIEPFEVLNGCFAKPSVPLMAALDLTEFDVESVFDALGDGVDIGAALDFSELDNFRAEINALSPEDFGLSQAVVNQSVEALNNLTSAFNNPIVYTEQDCTLTPVCDMYCLGNDTCANPTENPLIPEEELRTARTAVINVISAFDMVQFIIANMTENMDRIAGNVEDFKTSVRWFSDNITLVEESVDPLINAVNDIRANGNCTFLATRYYALHENLCSTALPGLLMVSLSMIFIGICGIVLILTVCCISTRLFGEKPNTAKVWTDRA